jgi:hypothetical protein
MKFIPNFLLQPRFLASMILLAAIPFALQARTRSGGGSDEEKVQQTISEAFKDLETGDFAGYRARLTQGFYMFDGGKCFSADVLIGQLTRMRASGTRYHWSVTKADVHVKGATAWIAYVNDGNVSTSEGVQSRQWLESAFLVKEANEWKVAFWHSTPIQPSQAPK